MLIKPNAPQPFAELTGETFLLLTTYRKNGEAVPTPVWFGQEDGRLFITTYERAGKTKRIRANPAVMVAPCNQVGAVHGSASVGRARILDADEQSVAINALRRKYGPLYDQMTGRMDQGQPTGVRVFILVEPAEE
jgi:hypothetical protein